MDYGKALTWDELADLYDESNTLGKRARTLSMIQVRAWAKSKPGIFFINKDNEGTIHLLEAEMTDESIVHAEQAMQESEKEADENIPDVITTEEAEKEKQSVAITEVTVDLTEANPLSLEVSPEFMKAYETLSSGRVPPEVVEKREGPAGLLFSYVPHWWVSRQLRLALGPLWDFNVLEITLHKDKSSSCKATLTVWIPLPDGSFHESKITAVGTFVDSLGMKEAYREASTVSRTLAKLVQLRFGIGEEFYAGEDEGIPKQTPAMAFATLKRYGTERGLTEEEIIEVFKADEDIVFDDLPEKKKYQYAYTVVGKMIREKKLALETEGAEGF